MPANRLHIAHFTNTYLPIMSGVVRSILSFRQAQEAMGHNVFIFGQDTPGYVDEEAFVFRYPALNIPVRNYPATVPVSPYIDWVLPTLKLDVIHCHHPAPMGNVAAAKAEKLNIPLVFTHHTRYQEYTHSMNMSLDLIVEVVERMLADYMNKCQHIIAPSPSIRHMIEETYGIREGISVVPTGIDLTPYKQADGAPIRKAMGWTADQTVIISVGRLASEKNFSTLLDAVARIFSHKPDVRLALIGDGPERSELELQARKLGIAQRVDFVGQVPFDQIPAYLRAADLFSFASVTETQGLVTLEAMAADLPVVAVDATGTSDIVVHEVNGLLTANNADDLAAGIERLLGDQTLQDVLKAGAVSTAAEYEIGRVTSSLIEVYHLAAEEKKANKYIKTDKRKPIHRMAWERFINSIERKN